MSCRMSMGIMMASAAKRARRRLSVGEASGGKSGSVQRLESCWEYVEEQDVVVLLQVSGSGFHDTAKQPISGKPGTEGKKENKVLGKAAVMWGNQ